jgi:hypothetical protein
MSNSA